MTYYSCPICGYAEMPDPPGNHNICPCCGTEFGYQDSARSHQGIRHAWLLAGARWFSEVTEQPPNWNPYTQLALASLESESPELAEVGYQIIEHPQTEFRPDRIIRPVEAFAA